MQILCVGDFGARGRQRLLETKLVIACDDQLVTMRQCAQEAIEFPRILQGAVGSEITRMDENVPLRHIETVVHTVGVAQYDKREVRSGHGITKLKCSTSIVRIVDRQTELASVN